MKIIYLMKKPFNEINESENIPVIDRGMNENMKQTMTRLILNGTNF